MSAKTEEATPKRDLDARKDGQSGQSLALAQSIGLVALAGTGLAYIRVTGLGLREMVLEGMGGHRGLPDPLGLSSTLILFLLPPPLLLAVASAMVLLVTSRGVVAKVRLDFSRISLAKGLSQLVGWSRLWSPFRGLLSAFAIVIVSEGLVRGHLRELAHTTGRPTPSLAAYLAPTLVLRASCVLLAFGVLDALVLHLERRRKLRMTVSEVMRERKESDGDPELKRARERAHQEVVVSAMVHGVRHATVVVVNPTHLACALRYAEEEEDTPFVVGLGQGEVARRIVREAAAFGIPVVEDVPLARALSDLSLGSEIPESLYEAVATVLRTVWEKDSGRVG